MSVSAAWFGRLVLMLVVYTSVAEQRIEGADLLHVNGPRQ